MLNAFAALFRQDPNYLKHIEGIRSLSAFRVMLCHVIWFGAIYYPLDEYLKLLDVPYIKLIRTPSVLMDSFFVLSGLVIAYSLMKIYKTQGKIDLYQFFVRRGARLIPLYIFTTILAIPIFFANIHNLWANILFINNQISIPNQYASWTWAMAVEVQFYILFGTVMWLLSKKFIGRKTCIMLALIFFLLPFVAIPIVIVKNQYYHIKLLSFVLPQPDCWLYLDLCFDKMYIRSTPILYGIFSAYILIYHRDTLQSITHRLSSLKINSIILTIIALILFVLVNDPARYLNLPSTTWQTSTYWTMLIQHQLLSFSFCVLLLLADSPKGFLMISAVKILNSAVLGFFGRLSYTTYMIHPLVFLYGFPSFFATHSHVTPLQYIQRGLWLILITYIIAIPCYYFFEKPLMKDIIQRYLRTRIQENTLSTVNSSQ